MQTEISATSTLEDFLKAAKEKSLTVKKTSLHAEGYSKTTIPNVYVFSGDFVRIFITEEKRKNNRKTWAVRIDGKYVPQAISKAEPASFKAAVHRFKNLKEATTFAAIVEEISFPRSLPAEDKISYEEIRALPKFKDRLAEIMHLVKKGDALSANARFVWVYTRKETPDNYSPQNLRVFGSAKGETRPPQIARLLFRIDPSMLYVSEERVSRVLCSKIKSWHEQQPGWDASEIF